MAIDVRTRLALMDDIPALCQMRWADSKEAAGGKPQGDGTLFMRGYEEFLSDALSDGRWAIWVAESDGRIRSHLFVQLVDMVPRPARFSRRLGAVSAVYTYPEFRNNGISSRLLQSAIGWARENRVDSLVLWAEGRVVSLYERAGFTRGGDVFELELGE